MTRSPLILAYLKIKTSETNPWEKPFHKPAVAITKTLVTKGNYNHRHEDKFKMLATSNAVLTTFILPRKGKS